MNEYGVVVGMSMGRLMGACIKTLVKDRASLYDFLGPDWPRDRPRHFIPLRRAEGEIEGDGTFIPTMWDMLPVEATHFVLVESEEELNEPSYYFNSQEVRSISAGLFFSETEQKYLAIHCPECCVELICFVTDHQRTWEHESRRLQEKATHPS